MKTDAGVVLIADKMAAVNLPSFQSYLLVFLSILNSLPILECYASPELSESNHVEKWSDQNRVNVRFARNTNEDTKWVDLEDPGHQEGGSQPEDSQPLRKSKRDIQEIIEGRPVNFPPVVIRRTTEALKQILGLLGGIEKTLINITTTTSPTSPPPPPTPQPQVVKTSTTTPPPPMTNRPGVAGANATTTPPTLPPAPPNTTVQPVLNSTAAPTTTAPTPAKNESVTSQPSKQPTTAPASTSPPTKPNSTTSSENILGDLVRAQVGDKAVGSTVAPVNGSSTPPPQTYSPRDVIIIFQALSQNAENVMADQLNMSTVIALEKSVETLALVNKTAAYIERGDGMSELKIWLKLVQMSCSHGLKKLEYGKQVMALFGHSDDITILITAAFCTLALICCIVACLVGNRPLKPSRGDYRLGGTPGTARPVASTRRNVSSASSEPRERPFSVYSSPAREAVSARSNPSYSSHRSVDVDPSASYRSAENNLNYDEPRVEGNDSDVPDATVAAKNDRNATRPPSRTSDYKDPRRHRRNLARGRSNEGYSEDEVIGVRSDSESVL